MKKNISSDNFYYYVPKINNANKTDELPLKLITQIKQMNYLYYQMKHIKVKLIKN